MGTGPIFYEVQTRCWLNEFGPDTKLDQVPEQALQAIKDTGAEWLWLMGVWQTGTVGRRIAAEHPDLQDSYRAALPDFTVADVAGSPYSIKEYSVNCDFGGDEALAIFRQRLKKYGLKLLLDFVPNHVALDNEWVFSHPEYFISGDHEALVNGAGVELETVRGRQILLHGRDPYFPPWTDTLQLNWTAPELLTALQKLLLRLAGMCDGLRCDMAMLLLKDIFQKTWGLVNVQESEPWQLLISGVKKQYPDFIFAAEAYWDLEWQLTCQGFDFVYDKRLYDRLCQNDAPGVAGHLHMDSQFHRQQLHFLENHDEPRVAERLSWPQHRAAAALISFLPGGWLFHHHQQDGARVKLPVQLRRYAPEPVKKEVQLFYKQLFTQRADIPKDAVWTILRVVPAWNENSSNNNIIACCWAVKGRPVKLLAVNLSATPSQGYLVLDQFILKERNCLVDGINSQRYERAGSDLLGQGLFVSLSDYGFHYFNIV